MCRGGVFRTGRGQEAARLHRSAVQYTSRALLCKSPRPTSDAIMNGEGSARMELGAGTGAGSAATAAACAAEPEARAAPAPALGSVAQVHAGTTAVNRKEAGLAPPASMLRRQALWRRGQGRSKPSHS